ncbi:MAG: S8 family serine peptidase [Candidatus Eremiobacteraeota bacterium]|nr:S8 family serine peptidase [Candidatus Eremiobacteraeota bacterium]MBV8204686.1 S8 family serine peptidase [Candidatus Eremiobacteraeota bacterium]
MKPTFIPVALIAAATLTAIGCGGGGSTTPAPTSTSTKSSGCAQSYATSPALGLDLQNSGIGLHAPIPHVEQFASETVAVRFPEGHISSAAAAALARLGARQATEPNPQGGVTFSIPQNVDPHMAASALHGVPGILSASPVIYRHVQGLLPDDPQFASGAVQESTGEFTNQWDFFAIQMSNAWAVTTGATSVRIAVIDTGYDLHNPDLIGKVDASVVYDLGNGTVDTACTVQDEDGHGSDVSGIAAADTNNLTNVAGVGWNVHLLEARVFPYGKNPGASTQDIAAAINWAVASGARVINMSLGSGSPDPTFEEPAVAAAISKGVIVVAAAGNDGRNTVDYPAADPGVIAVGASAYCDKATPASACGTAQNVLAGGHEYVAGYSNFGAGLSLVAPGGDPDAAQTKCTTLACVDFLQWIDNLDSTAGPFKEQVGLFAGTSQATPHVAGAAALMVSKDPALTPAQALSIVKATADNIFDPHMGSGRLNVFKALNATP